MQKGQRWNKLILPGKMIRPLLQVQTLYLQKQWERPVPGEGDEGVCLGCPGGSEIPKGGSPCAFAQAKQKESNF